jgi:uncharacterized protein (TIRG00374 family)
MPRWIKVAVAVALMAFLAWSMDWSEIAAHSSDLDWVLAAIAFLAILLEMPVNAAKWYWSLRLHDQSFPWRYLFRIGCMSYFFNNFMPSAIGGDVYRVYRTWPASGDKAFAISAVFVERLVGVAILMANGFVGALFLLDYSLARTLVIVAIAASALGIACLPFILRMQRKGTLSRRFPKLASIEAMLGRLLRWRREWAALLLASCAFQALAAWIVYLCFAAVGASIDAPTALLITAAAGLASVLPISISGIGVVEGSIAGTVVALGGNLEAGVLAALLLRVLALGVSALCGVACFVDDGSRIQPSSADAELRSQSGSHAAASRTAS